MPKKVKVKIIDPQELFLTEINDRDERQKINNLMKSQSMRIVSLHKEADLVVFVGINCDGFIKFISTHWGLKQDQIYYIPHERMNDGQTNEVDNSENFFAQVYPFAKENILRNFDFNHWELSLIQNLKINSAQDQK
jgi:hypothetical protein